MGIISHKTSHCATRTNFLRQVVPLELFQVLEAPQVVVVCIPPPPPHGGTIERLCNPLGHPLVLKLNPALGEALASVLIAALALGSQCRVCVWTDGGEGVVVCGGVSTHTHLRERSKCV